MLYKIKRFSEKYNMFHDGDCVVCGLSGGADSVCLILALSELSDELGIKVEALHVNHCLRGSESNRDENFCRKLCNDLEIPFTSVSCNVREYADKFSLSEEEAARKMRYGIFSEYSKGKLIATAHNANDNLETAILNLTRGSAIKGISGIPPVRDNIVRPLLTVSRLEIEDFLKQKNIEFVTDSTNLSDDFTRNKIRHLILPLLNEINPSAVSTFVNSSDALRDENDYIDSETQKALKICRTGNTLKNISDFPSVIRRRCIAKLFFDNNIPYSYKRLAECENIALKGGKINISGDFFLISDKTDLSLVKIQKNNPDIPVQIDLKLGDNIIFKHKLLNANLINVKTDTINQNVNSEFTFYYLDYDKIIGKVIVRNRRFGDKIKLYGKNFTSSVKKLINEKISPDLRSELYFLEDESGTVFAEGIGIAARTAPDKNTKKLLKITVRKF